MSETTIYLAGPVAALDDGGAGWRDRVTEQFADVDVSFENPLAKYNVAIDGLEIVPGVAPEYEDDVVGVADIVRSDKQLIGKSDAVLVGYSDVKSIGTPMEVMFASSAGIPVVVWVRDETSLMELSPWYRYHASETTHDLEAAVAHLRSQRTARGVVR